MKPRTAFKALAGARKRPDTPCCYLRFYGLVVSSWLRPPWGRDVMSACMRCVPFCGCLSWLPRGVPLGPSMRAGVCSRSQRGRVNGRHQVILSVEKGSSARGLLLRCLVASTSEARVNLATPLCGRHLSAADSLPACPFGVVPHRGTPCHYLLRASDRAPAVPRPRRSRHRRER